MDGFVSRIGWMSIWYDGQTYMYTEKTDRWKEGWMDGWIGR